jgi:hypothetical protein
MSLRVSLSGYILFQAPSYASLCFLNVTRVAPSYALTTMMLCFTPNPEKMEPANHDLKPLKLGAKINLSSFQLVSLKYLSQQ